MKTRTGFVSNSSSSSFLLVGVKRWGNKDLYDQISAADGVLDNEEFELGYGQAKSASGLLYCGVDFEPSLLGLEIEQLMETMTLPELKKHFQDFIKQRFNIDVPLKQVELHYGEMGN